MKNFDKGVSYYTNATVTVHFPEDDIVCQNCPLMRVESRSERRYCGLTGDLLYSPQYQRSAYCPLQIDGSADLNF